MSRVLVEKETIYTEEVKMLMAGATVAEVIEAMEKREGEHEANPFGKMGQPSAEEAAELNANGEETSVETEATESAEVDVAVETTAEEPVENAENPAEEAEEEKSDEE